MLLKKLLSKNLGDCDLKTGNNITTVKCVLFRQHDNIGERAIDGYGLKARTNNPNCPAPEPQPFQYLFFNLAHRVRRAVDFYREIGCSWPITFRLSQDF